MKNTFLVLLACWFCTIPNAVLGQQLSQLLIDGAMKECHTGRIAQDRATRIAHFTKGEALGEQAVASDDQSAEAHFALFCNLGELMRIDGELSITSVMGLCRMTKELDRKRNLHLITLTPYRLKVPFSSGFLPCLEETGKRARSSSDTCS